MNNWSFEHPFLTFFIILAGFQTVMHVATCVFKVFEAIEND